MGGYFGDFTDFLAVVGAVCVVLTLWKRVVCVVWRVIARFLPVDVKQFGRWAVVTGSTDGIGKSYAFKLAEKGMDIVLISRNPEKLSAVAKEIGEKHQVSVKVVTADFKQTDIYDNIRQQLSGLDIGVLVNNVGMLNRRSPCYFCEAEDFEQYNKDLVNVNVLACVMMTTLVLPGMLERKRGAIINLSSTAGMRPLPFLSMYSASKAFVSFFSEALNLEYSNQGVTIQGLMPSIVRTPMSKPVADCVDVRQGLIYPSADRYVAAAINTIGHESSTAAYWPHELRQYAISLMPKSFLRRVFLQARDQVAEKLKIE